MNPDPATRRRTEGPTPNGGAYAIAFFRDANGKPCTESEAAGMEIVEFDARDEVIRRTYMQDRDLKDVPI